MISDTIQHCCDVVTDVFDGKYGWLEEALTLLGIVLVFNILIKALLNRLQLRYEKEGKIWKNCFIRAMIKPMIYAVWFIALADSLDVISLRVFEENFYQLTFMHRLIELTILFAVAWFLIRWKKNVFKIMIYKSKNHEVAIEQGRVDMISKLVTVIIFFMTILLAMEITERDMSTLIAFGGIGGIALAFASQKIVANFFSGLVIYITRPFDIGDWIYLPERSIEGYVEDIGWHMTRVRTFDMRPVYVPNSIFSEIVIMTPSRMSHRQIKERFGVRYQDLPVFKLILDDLKAMLKEHLAIDHKQRILVGFVSFGAYSLEFMVDVYTHKMSNEEFADVKEDILFKIAKIVKSHGADMPCPTMKIDVKEVPHPVI